MKHPVLGKGLSTLLQEDTLPVSSSKYVISVDLDKVTPGKLQPRKAFNNTKLKELADSIAVNGLLQPIVVSSENNEYKIIAGERRYRACKMLGLTQIPVIVKDIEDNVILELALIENIQREELTSIEEAEAYLKLMQDFGYTQEDISNNVGKSRSHIGNLLRLNKLPEIVKNYINEEKLSMGHARCLIGQDDAIELAGKIIANDLSVRQTEDLIKRRKQDKVIDSEKEIKQDDDLIILSQALSDKYGVKVVIENSWKGGRISFHYNSLEELDAILMRIN